MTRWIPSRGTAALRRRSRRATWARREGGWLLAATVATISVLAPASPSPAASAASAPEAPPVAADPDSALSRAVASLAGEPLRLADALRLTLANATAVGEAAALLRGAHGTLRRERGAFDPELFASVLRSSSDQPTASPFAGAAVLATDELATTAGARLHLWLGTDLEASLETNRLESNSVFATLDPEYRTSGRLELRQPLLKGFGPAASSERSAAEHALASAASSYREARLAARALAEVLYWELHAAERDLAVQKLIVEQAEAFLAEARTRAAAGLIGPNEVANAAVFLAEQQLTEIDLAERLDGASDRLATLMGVRPAAGADRFHPRDAPPRSFEVAPPDTLIADAVDRNPVLQSARDELAAQRASMRGARWEALPALDLVGSLGGSGLSGRGRDVIFGADTLRVDMDSGFGPSWAQVRDRDFPTWSVGVEFSLPIGLRADRGERDRRRAEVERLEQRVEAVRRDLEERVRFAYREIAHGARRLEVAERGVEASYEQVRIGSIEFENGRTTAFELVRLGADLAAAQQRFSEALVRTARAHAELRRLTAAGMEQMDAAVEREVAR